MQHHEVSQYLSNLNSKLVQLEPFPGFPKLGPGIKAKDWQQYYETLAEIKADIWFAERGLLKEIQPELSHTRGRGDILILLSGQLIYCEVTARRFPNESDEKDDRKEARLKKLREEQPWATQADLDDQDEIRKMLGHLRGKTRRQLPPNFPGILVLDTGRAMFYQQSTKKLAGRLFASQDTSQVILIMLWSLERGSQIGEPPFWFVNRRSCFHDIGLALLKSLGQEQNIVECD